MVTSAENAALSILGAANIHFDIQPRGTKQNALGGNTEMDKWEWEVIFSNVGCAQSFDYFTGKGFRKLHAPVKPHVAGVLYSLINDSNAIQYTFEEWADCYGYDTDSRKAEKTYYACRENGEKLSKVIPVKILESLAEVLQDY